MTAHGAGWREEPLPVGLYHLEARAYYHKARRLTALLSRDEVEPGDKRWHISVRYGDPGVDGRVCSWEELVQAAHDLRPGVPFAVGVPPRSWWMSVHPHVLHLWELRDAPLLAQWQAERMGHEPT